MGSGIKGGCMPTSEKDVLTEILIKVARIEENTKSLDKVSEKAIR